MNLPPFRYHPDPMATGSIVVSEKVCLCCREARGAIYTGPTYSEEEIYNALCPWCIADGSAAAKFDAEFVGRDGIGGYGDYSPVPNSVRDEISRRTPGYVGWQQESWWTHCNDGAAYLGMFGREELDGLGESSAEAWQAVRAATGFEGETWDHFVSRLSLKGDTATYLFRCLHCGQLGATWDCG